MDKRAITIFKILAKSKGYVTSDNLCDQIGVRPRTLREDLRRYRDVIETSSGATLESKTNQGYRLNIHDEEKFYHFLQSLLEEEANNQFLMPVDQEDRIHYIIRYFLSKNDYIKSEDLADEIYISRSTLSADLKKVKERLDHFNLQLESRVGSGLKIVGEERNIRSCMAEYYFHSGDFDTEQLKQASNQFFDKTHEETVRRILYEVLRRNQFKLTDIGFQNLVIHLLIAIHRIEENTILHDNAEQREKLQKNKEWEVAQEIAEELEDAFLIKIPEGEIDYITIHLLGKKIYEKEEDLVVHPETINLVQNILKAIKENYDYDFFSDIELFTMLSLHFQPMLNRAQYGLKMANPLLDRIKEESPLAYEISVLAGKVIYEKTGLEIDENEFGFLALHFQLAMAKNHSFEKKNVIIVCASGAGTSQILLYKVKQQFRDNIAEAKVVSSFDLQDMDLSNYDLILSTIPLSFETKIPVIQVQYYLENDDITEVRKILLQDEDEIQMIKGYFGKNLFFSNQTFSTPNEIIHFMCEALNQQINLPPIFEKLVLEREKLASTALGNRVAMPHPTQLLLEDTKVVVCHLKQPIDWHGTEVSIVFLLGVKKEAESAMTLYNEVMASFISNKAVINRILADPSFDNFMETISSLCNEKKTQKPEDLFQ